MTDADWNRQWRELEERLKQAIKDGDDDYALQCYEERDALLDMVEVEDDWEEPPLKPGEVDTDGIPF